MKTLSPSLTLILTSILVLTSILPLASCSDDAPIICELPQPTEFSITVTGNMGDFLLPAMYGEEDITECPVFVVNEWKGTDSEYEMHYKGLEDALSKSGQQLCVVLPEDFVISREKDDDFSMMIKVIACYSTKKYIVLKFIDYIDNSTVNQCGTIAPETPTIYSSSRASLVSDKVINIFVHIVRSTSGVGLNKEVKET